MMEIQKFLSKNAQEVLQKLEGKESPLSLLLLLFNQKGSLASLLLKTHSLKREHFPKTIKKNRKVLFQVLEQALTEAVLRRQRFIGTEHLLYGLVSKPPAETQLILKKLQTPKKPIHQKIDGLNSLKNHLEQIFKTSNNFPNRLNESMPRAIKRIKHIKNKLKPRTVLEMFGENLLKKARDKTLPSLIGRENELNSLIRTLIRKTKSNPLLIGDAGVGKTTLVYGLVNKIIDTQKKFFTRKAKTDWTEQEKCAICPHQILCKKPIYEINLSSLVAGTVFRGEFESRLKTVIEEARRNKAIIFIDEIHTLIGAGAVQGSLDAANILKPFLSSGDIQIIGATTTEDYRRYFEKDSALERRFQPIFIKESSPQETLSILKGIKARFEKHYTIIIPDVALKEIIALSTKFIRKRSLPDKAIDLLDESCAFLKIHFNQKTPPLNSSKQIKLLQQIEKTAQEKNSAIAKEDYKQAEKLKLQEKKLNKELKNKNKEFLKTLTNDVIHKTFKTLYNFSPVKNTAPDNLLRSLKQEIIGQDKALGLLSARISYNLNKKRTDTDNRPLGSFLFLGPSGCGKTASAKLLANILQKQFLKIDMSEFAESHTISRFLGAPAGYVGYEDGSQFLNFLRKNPEAIIILDEVDKAHKQVIKILLQILDEGELSSSDGSKIDFKQTIIIMTSNMGMEKLKNKNLGFSNDKKTSLEEMLKDIREYLGSEIIGRIDQIISFEPLKQLSIRKLIQKYAKQALLRLNEERLSAIAQKASFSEEGARSIQKLIDKEAMKSYFLKP